MDDFDRPRAELEKQLHKHFGHPRFHDDQYEAIVHLLNKHDLLAVMPTGSGKSLIYQFAALRQPEKSLTIVISPLIALMKDQVDQLSKHNYPATYINSTLSPDEQSSRLQQMAQGNFKLVYLAPERLRQYSFQEEISKLKVTLLVVDEAHCISQWGHDFRPDYLYIARFREMLGNPTTVALTATATKRVRGDIVRLLGLSPYRQMVTGFDRPNIYLNVRQVWQSRSGLQEEQKRDYMLQLLRNWDKGTAIVYVGTRRDAELIAEFLRERIRVPISYYHGDVEPDVRAQIQEAFINGDLPIIVATNAFGMGIDRSDVRLVIHHKLPGSLEAYYQEIGRAGRDGEQSSAVLLYHPDDRELQDFFIWESRLSYDDLQKIYQALIVRCRSSSNQVWVTTKELSQACGLNEEGNKAKVGLQRLEEAKVIEQGFYEGNQQSFTLLGWKEDHIHRVLHDVEEHFQHRSNLLDKMIGYATNSTKCRRQKILDYFDDTVGKQIDQKHCCDAKSCNDVRGYKQMLQDQSPAKRQSTTGIDDPRAEVFTGISDCVRDYPGKFGAHELVALLSGETSERYSPDNRYFGKLRFFGQNAISEKVNVMIKRQRLRRNSNGKLIPGTDKDHKPKQSRTKSLVSATKRTKNS